MVAARNLRLLRHKGDDVVNADPKKAIVTGVLASWDQWPYPPLQRITGAPTFAPDGSLRTEPGYHPESETLYVPDDGLTIRPFATDASSWEPVDLGPILAGEVADVLPEIGRRNDGVGARYSVVGADQA